MIQLPEEILHIDQWTHSFSIAEIKRPKHTSYKSNGGLSYKFAVQAAGKYMSYGFYVTEEDPYILGDIDHVDNPLDQEHLATILHPALSNILFNMKVYSEVSPSGDGIRFIARLEDIATKQLLDGQYFKNHIDMGVDNKGKDRETQFNIGRPWQRLTGNRTPYSSDIISVIPLEDLDEIYRIARVTDDPVGTDYVPPPDSSSDAIPTTDEMFRALRSLPWDNNPRIKRAFKVTFGGENYTPYEYWLKVMMGMSDYSSKLNDPNMSMACSEAILKWSEKDTEGFTGVKDVLNKWQSFSRMENKVSYHTVLSLAHYNKIHWPVAKPPNKKQIEAGITMAQPLVTQYSNFRALANFYDLKLYRDANTPHKMYLTGDEDILQIYFSHLDITRYFDIYSGPWSVKNLPAKLSFICQEHGFIGITRNHIMQNLSIWVGEINRKVDMVKLYFDTPFEQLPKEYQENALNRSISTPEFLFSCLDIEFLTEDVAKEEALYFKYYKSWLMGIARNIFFPDSMHMNNSVLLLTGAEQIRKTSHFKFILPRHMREERIAFSGHGFATEASVRDVTKLATTNNLIVWDEVETYLNSETESNFKKLIDNNRIKVIDKYEVLDSYLIPIAAYGATSNQRLFKLSDNGSRRIFHIPLKWVDTDKMDQVNWWQLINDLRDEIGASTDPPWLLTLEELEYQVTLHGKITKKSSLDLIVEESFNFGSDPCPVPTTGSIIAGASEWNFRDGHEKNGLWTVAGVLSHLRKYHPEIRSANRTHMLNVLKRLCGRWTGTMRSPRVFEAPRISIFRGEITYSGRTKFWMPTVNAEASKSPFEEDI